MTQTGWAIVAGLLASTGALIGSAVVLLVRRRAEAISSWLVAFAIGALLGAATFHLLAEALEAAPVDRVMALFVAGVLGFTAFELVLRWRHPHHAHAGEAQHAPADPATSTLLLAGDTLHNLLDGMVLGVSFHVSPELGFAAVTAVVAHEVPQEIADYATLLQLGMPPRRAFGLNYLSALASVPGALIASAWAASAEQVIGVLLPLAAGAFVYIALTDLIPALHHQRGWRAGSLQMVLILAGVAMLWWFAQGEAHA